MARSKNWPTLLNHAHLSNAELEDTLVAGINFQPKGLPSPLFPTTHGRRNGCWSRCCRTLYTIRVRKNQEPISLLTLLHRTASGKRC